MKSSCFSPLLGFLGLFLTVPLFVLAQGPLAPPGAPGPTMKSLDEVYSAADAARQVGVRMGPETTPGDADSTYIIDEPGFYYLGEPFIGEDAKNGITVTTDTVTINLHGFTMTGTDSSLNAIKATSGAWLTVQDGTLLNWPAKGIWTGRGARIVNVAVREITGVGIDAGSDSYVEGCRVAGSSTGIRTGEQSFIERCIVDTCLGTGVSFSGDCQVRNSVSSHNGGDGFRQSSASGAIIENCRAASNGASGFNVCSRSMISNNIADGNTVAGIESRCGRNILTGNFLYSNGTGVELSSDNEEHVRGNTFVNNTKDIASTTGNYVALFQKLSGATNPFANLTDQ